MAAILGHRKIKMVMGIQDKVGIEMVMAGMAMDNSKVVIGEEIDTTTRVNAEIMVTEVVIIREIKAMTEDMGVVGIITTIRTTGF
jgi:DNA transposition AAA+ family ATPase